MEDKILHQHSEVESVLAPCTSFETAHIVHDYPYGGYRTDMAYWVEYRKGKGFRPVTCSLNPKNGKWNKPHAGVYQTAMAMYIEMGTHFTRFAHFTAHDNAKLAAEFYIEFESGLTPEGKSALKLLEFIDDTRKEISGYGNVTHEALIRLKAWEEAQK
jgi:hypothetical protein